MIKAPRKAKSKPRTTKKSGLQPNAAARPKAAARLKAPAQPKAPKGEHPLLRQLSKICLSLPEAARRDLEKYLELDPEAPDRDDIQKSLEKIHQWLARVN